MNAHVLGVGMTPFGRSPSSLQDLFVSAAEAALAEAGDVDAIIVGAMAPEEYLHESNLASQIADRLGLQALPALRIETASSSGAAAFHMAVQMVAAGGHRRVLAVAGEKMTHVSTSLSTRIMAQVLDHRDRQLGMSMPAMAALVTSMYAREHGISERRLGEALAAVAMKNHANGALNPYAQFQREITRADYFQARLIASPLRLFDCAPISDGAAAVVVAAEPSPIRVIGIGQATDRLSLSQRSSVSHFPATQWAAARAYAMARLQPERVTFAEVHDAFTSFELISVEDLGLVARGCAVDAVLGGETALHGQLPINPSGGLKARGHPVGASGLAQIVEIVWQMRGAVAPARRIACPDVALALSIGGPGANNFVTLLERSAHAVPVRSPLASRAEPQHSDQRPEPPPRRGRATVLTHTHFALTSRSAPQSRRLALVECLNGSRLVVRMRKPSTPVEPGDRVRFAVAGSQYCAAPIDRLRRLRVRLRRLKRALRRAFREGVAATQINRTGRSALS